MHLNYRPRITLLTIVALGLGGCGATESKTAPMPDAAESVPETSPGEASRNAGTDEPWYPRTLTSDAGSAIIHAPQIDAWQDFETLSAWVAFRVSRTGSDDTYYGSLEFNAKTETDIRAREVLLYDVEVLDLSIDGLSENSDEYALIRDGFTAMSRKVPLPEFSK